MMQLFKITILFVWLLLIFILSHEPAGESSARSAVIVDAVGGVLPFANDFLTFMVRKSAHIVAYFILGLLVFNAVAGHKLRAKYAIALSIACVFAYAVFDEVHQLFVPGRSGEVSDVLLDTTAGAVGVYSYWLFWQYKYRHKPRTTVER